jgi:hypothetical protein
MLLKRLELSTKIKKTEHLAISSWRSVVGDLFSFGERLNAKARTSRPRRQPASRRRYKIKTKMVVRTRISSITTTILRIASSMGLTCHREQNSIWSVLSELAD